MEDFLAGHICAPGGIPPNIPLSTMEFPIQWGVLTIKKCGLRKFQPWNMLLLGNHIVLSQKWAVPANVPTWKEGHWRTPFVSCGSVGWFHPFVLPMFWIFADRNISANRHGCHIRVLRIPAVKKTWHASPPPTKKKKNLKQNQTWQKIHLWQHWANQRISA